jgi:glutathione synthase/RimK-type ligase-like ATP-grasp enzyme
MAAAMGLALAGIDLRRTDKGEWFCFEVNPSPAFTYYEEATGQPITDAVARLLLTPARRGV